MATPLVLTNAQIYGGPVDLTGATNQVSLDFKADELDSTTFSGNGWRSRLGGLKDVDMKHEGFMELPNPDAEMFAELGLNGIPFTVATNAIGGSGHVAYVFNAARSDYDILGAVGVLAPMSGEVMGDARLGVGRGAVLLDNAAVTGSVTGTGNQLGAAPNGALAAFHVLTAGSTATITIQSDDNSGFTSPTTQATLVATSSAQSSIASIGITTDTYWRVSVASVTGTFSLKVSLGLK